MNLLKAIIGITLFSFLMTCCVIGDGVITSEDYPKQLLNQGNYSEALFFYEKLLHDKPDDPDIWNNRGVALLRLHRCDEALESFLKSIELKSEDATGYINAAQANFCLGDKSQALILLEEAVLYEPDNLYLWKEIGRTQRENGAFEAALQSYTSIWILNKTDTDALYAIGELSFQLQHYDKAVVAYSNINQIDPTDELAWYNLGVNYEAMNQFASALDAYNKTVELDELHYKGWSNIGNIYYAHNRYSEALSAFDKVIEIKPELSDVWFIRAICLLNLNDLNASVESFENASKLAPDDIEKKAYLQKYSELSHKNEPNSNQLSSPYTIWLILLGIIGGVMMINHHNKK